MNSKEMQDAFSSPDDNDDRPEEWDEEAHAEYMRDVPFGD